MPNSLRDASVCLIRCLPAMFSSNKIQTYPHLDQTFTILIKFSKEHSKKWQDVGMIQYKLINNELIQNLRLDCTATHLNENFNL